MLEKFVAEYKTRNNDAPNQGAHHRPNHLAIVAISNPHELTLLEACILQISNLLDAGDVEHDFGNGTLICYEEMTHLEVRSMQAWTVTV